MLWRTAISTNTLFLTDISLNEQYSRPGTIYLFLRVEKFSASIFSDIHHPLEAPKSLETATEPSTASLLWHVLFIKLFFSRTKYHGQRYSNHRSFIDSCNFLKANTIKLEKFPQSMSYHCTRSNMMSKNSATTLESCRTLHLSCRLPCPTV